MRYRLKTLCFFEHEILNGDNEKENDGRTKIKIMRNN